MGVAWAPCISAGAASMIIISPARLIPGGGAVSNPRTVMILGDVERQQACIGCAWTRVCECRTAPCSEIKCNK